MTQRKCGKLAWPFFCLWIFSDVAWFAILFVTLVKSATCCCTVTSAFEAVGELQYSNWRCWLRWCTSVNGIFVYNIQFHSQHDVFYILPSLLASPMRLPCCSRFRAFRTGIFCFADFISWYVKGKVTVAYRDTWWYGTISMAVSPDARRTRKQHGGWLSFLRVQRENVRRSWGEMRVRMNLFSKQAHQEPESTAVSTKWMLNNRAVDAMEWAGPMSQLVK